MTTTRPTRNRPRKAGRSAAALDQNGQKGPEVQSDTPLAYMLAIVRDPTADPRRRDRMAKAAAQYCHPRAVEPGKKARRAEAAKDALADFNDDLGWRRRR